jgi:hypothetical protein
MNSSSLNRSGLANNNKEHHKISALFEADIPLYCQIPVKLLVRKSIYTDDRKYKSRIIYMETSNRFVDLICAILSQPLACLSQLLIHPTSAWKSKSSLKLFNCMGTITSISNLSPKAFLSPIAKQRATGEYANAEVSDLLTQLVHANPADKFKAEAWSRIYEPSGMRKCEKCNRSSAPLNANLWCEHCFHLDLEETKLHQGRYTKDNAQFMVSRDLRVQPLSMGEIVSLLKEENLEMHQLQTVEALFDNHMVRHFSKKIIPCLSIPCFNQTLACFLKSTSRASPTRVGIVRAVSVNFCMHTR